MRYSRNFLCTACAWLTAVLTLFAGIPPFACRCPNGTIKLYCTGSTTGCCCSGSCCPVLPDEATSNAQEAPSSAEGKLPCCCGPREPVDQLPSSETPAQAGSNCCTKLVLPAPVVAVVPPQTTTTEDEALVLFLSVQELGLAPFAASPVTASPAEYRGPPPRDRLALLQRLLL